MKYYGSGNVVQRYVGRELDKRPYHHGEPMWRFYLRASIQVMFLQGQNPIRWWLWRMATRYVERETKAGRVW
jgi:hypothetical protein